MATIAQIETKLNSRLPEQIEEFRRKLQHGQEGWTTREYVELYKDRRDLQTRFCDLLDLPTEEEKGIQANINSYKVSMTSLIISIIALLVAVIALFK
jgi:hypothetical protein